MIRDIVYFIASLFIFGLAYIVINLVISILRGLFTIDDMIVLGVYFLWSMIPLIYYLGKAREFLSGRGVSKFQGEDGEGEE